MRYESNEKQIILRGFMVERISASLTFACRFMFDEWILDILLHLWTFWVVQTIMGFSSSKVQSSRLAVIYALLGHCRSANYSGLRISRSKLMTVVTYATLNNVA